MRIILSIINVAFLSIVLIAQNPPIIVDDTVYAMSGTDITINIESQILYNDFDNEGNAFELAEVNDGFMQAEIEIAQDGNLYYSPVFPTNMYEDRINYRIREVENPDVVSEWGKIVLIYEPNPDLPYATKDYAQTTAGIPISINIMENDLSNGYNQLIVFPPFLSAFGNSVGSYNVDEQGNFSYIPYYEMDNVVKFRYALKDTTDTGSLPFIAWGEIEIQVDPIRYSDSVDINNINAGVRADGYLFGDIFELQDFEVDNYEPHFEYPKGSGKNTIFCSSLWIGGLDNENNLHLAAQQYKQNGWDFQAGPISNSYDYDHKLKWNRVWKVNKTEINYHINNYWKENYVPIPDIIDWPGNGDETLGQLKQIAPFFDNNNNEIYEPLLGDYPQIRGDQTVLFIFNDDRLHTETNGESLKVEIHGMAYAFDNPSDDLLNNSVFVHYDIINRSENTYNETYVGMFSDTDIGISWDDYVMCNVENGSYIAYNGIEIDGNGEPGSYGENPPAQSTTILAGLFMDDDQIDNPDDGCDFSINGLNFGDGITDNERLGMTSFIYYNNNAGDMGTPYIASQYYNYMKAFWKDNTKIQYGGTGHLTGSGTVGPDCKFMFPVNSDPMNWGTDCNYPNGGYNQDGKYWSEETGDNGSPNPPGDRRGIAISGPITFKPGDTQELELAFVIGQGDNGPLNSVNQLNENINSLITMVETGEIIIPNEYLAVDEKNSFGNEIIIYPNPVIDQLTFNCAQNEMYTLEYDILSITGNILLSGKVSSDTDVTIDTQQLESGLYLLLLKTKDGYVTGRFVKN